MLELEQNLGPGTIITTYAYDTANQLETAQQGSTTWQYTYDANGSLISDGVKNYTYNSANRLVQVSDQLSVTSLSYNGLGQRLSMDAAGVIATYVLDGDRPLTATSNNNTTFYLYGLGVIGEKTTDWNYSLPDGTNTSRQLTDIQGDITLSARYTPWGDSLELHGTGNFSFGYLGGVLDATTGLIYVGNGQYYDPATGRFLTRDVNPDSTNPYVPWNPIEAILAPLAVLSMYYGQKKKRSKWDTLAILVLLGVTVGIGVVACAPAPTPPSGSFNTASPAMPAQTQTPVPTNPGTVPATPTGTPAAPIETPTAIPCPTPRLVPSLDLYGIVYGGTSWTLDEQVEILGAIQKVGEEFSRIRGTGETSWDAFKIVYGDGVLFHRGGRSGDPVCNGGVPQTVKCFGSAPMGEQSPVRLLVHELGHTLVKTRYYEVETPYNQVRDLKIVDDTPVNEDGPFWVTGTHPTGGACLNNADPNSALGRQCAATDADHYGSFQRTSRGYMGPGAPHQYHGAGWTDFVANENEDFADMFMNWVYNSFDYRPEAYNAGWYRYYFMEDNMRNWITGGSITTRNSVP